LTACPKGIGKVLKVKKKPRQAGLSLSQAKRDELRDNIQ
jgi:hypothetical protein